MTIRDNIQKLIKQNREVDGFLETASSNHADDALIDYLNFLKQSGYSGAMSLYFANLLQFVSDPDLSEQFGAEDIEQLYDSFLKLSEKCSDIYIDAASFADHTLNDKAKAKRIAELGIKRMQIQIAELEALLRDVAS